MDLWLHGGEGQGEVGGKGFQRGMRRLLGETEMPAVLTVAIVQGYTNMSKLNQIVFFRYVQ